MPINVTQGMVLLLLKPLNIPANYALNLIIFITDPKNKIGYWMKNKTISFIKKYPISILLGIIVINLMTISAHLRVNSELAFKKVACSRYFAFYAYGTDQQAAENELKTADKLKIPLELVDAYCQRIVRS